jgi:hexosaminidase
MLVSRQTVNIVGNAREGVFYGAQSLLQLIRLSETRVCDLHIPVVEIHDHPSYPWRGIHLDVSRHFFHIEFIKKFIDLLAMYKFNVFHWHLTDDQGWRIEIKKYPKLTEVGAWRTESDGTRYGGFYTQDDIREIVDYAEERYIRVMPEIEMPGHAMAALAAYPEYSCTGGPFEVPNTWGVFDDTFCIGNEKTIEFLRDVLEEAADMFPSPYIHIGCDECTEKRWREHELCRNLGCKDNHNHGSNFLSFFIGQIFPVLRSLRKEKVCWDEVAEAVLQPEAIIMAWRGMDYGRLAAQRGCQVIMTPTSHCYFDYYQAQKGEPKAIGGYLPLEKVYEFNPTPADIAYEARPRILGGQGNIWTEYMPDANHVEYMALPRMCAMAEALWSPYESRDFEDFKERLKTHYPRFDLMDVFYRPHN